MRYINFSMMLHEKLDLNSYFDRYGNEFKFRRSSNISSKTVIYSIIFFLKNDIVFNLYCDKFYIFYPCGYFQIFNFQFLLLCFQINLQLINIIHHFSAVLFVVRIFYHL